MVRRHRAIRAAVAILMAWAVMSARRAAADAAPRWTDEQLVGFSDLIVRGRVTGLSVGRDSRDGPPYTYVALEVIDALRGAIPDRRIVLKQLGGALASSELRVAGQPTFVVGEDVVVFLEVRPRDSTLTTTAQWQGKFTIVPGSAGSDVALRSDPQLLHRGIVDEDRRQLAPWLEELRRLSRGRPQGDVGAMAFIPDEAARATPGPGADRGPATATWRDAAGKRPVVRVDTVAPAQSRLADHAETDLRRAAEFWTDTGLITLAAGGLQPPHCLFSREPDGRIAVGLDTCGELSAGGGTIAISGAWLRRDDTNPAVGSIVGAGVMINGGSTATQLLGRAGCLEQLALHDLGHTLNLVHSGDAGPMTPFLRCESGFGAFASGPAGTASTASYASARDSRPLMVAIGSGGAPALSGDGRFIAFVGTDGIIRVYDRTTGTSSSEVVGSQPALSHDGRFLAFFSSATGIVPGVSGTQVYVRDRTAGSTVVASVSSSGVPGNLGASASPSISGDGGIVAFVSSATNLVPGSSGLNVFTRDLKLGVTTQENLDADGRPMPLGQCTGGSLDIALSADGRHVAFSQCDGGIVVRDRSSGQVAIEPTSPFLAASPSLSDDGRFLLFQIVIGQLAPGSRDTRLRDLQTGTIAQLPANARSPQLSGDSRFVSYLSVVGFPGYGAAVWDRSTGQTIDLGRTNSFNVGISRVASDAVAYSIDDVVYLAATDQPLSAPANLSATVVGSTVTLAWTAPPGATVTNYVVEAGSAPGASNLASFSTNSTATTFVASGVGPGTYFVRVRAAGSGGTSPPSNEVTIVVSGGGCIAPLAPTNLAAFVSGSSVTLTWSASAGATTYLIDVGSVPGQLDILTTDLGSPATTLTATNVGVRTYFVRLRAANSCGTSGPSNEVTVVVR
jgi:Tol biopolymer transport system component